MKFGTRIEDSTGRLLEYVEPGWWQPVLTDEERKIMASGETPEEWEPTPAEIEAAQEYARDLLGTSKRNQMSNARGRR